MTPPQSLTRLSSAGSAWCHHRRHQRYADLKYVQYDTGSGSVAAVSGNVTYWYTLDGYKNNQVTSDLSDSVEIGAGHSAPTDGQYCWIRSKARQR